MFAPLDRSSSDPMEPDDADRRSEEAIQQLESDLREHGMSPAVRAQYEALQKSEAPKLEKLERARKEIGNRREKANAAETEFPKTEMAARRVYPNYPEVAGKPFNPRELPVVVEKAPAEPTSRQPPVGGGTPPRPAGGSLPSPSGPRLPPDDGKRTGKEPVPEKPPPVSQPAPPAGPKPRGPARSGLQPTTHPAAGKQPEPLQAQPAAIRHDRPRFLPPKRTVSLTGGARKNVSRFGDQNRRLTSAGPSKRVAINVVQTRAAGRETKPLPKLGPGTQREVKAQGERLRAGGVRLAAESAKQVPLKMKVGESGNSGNKKAEPAAKPPHKELPKQPATAVESRFRARRHDKELSREAALRDIRQRQEQLQKSNAVRQQSASVRSRSLQRTQPPAKIRIPPPRGRAR